ncbi:MAG: type IV secretion system DNA-binding domain-containing protein, partial [Actinomycetota bacterium]
CHLNARELTGPIAWPIEGPLIPGLALAGSRSTLPDPAVPPGPRVVGEATFSGAERQIALPEREALHHMHVVGPTGTGKSTLLANLILQDISDGRAVVVIDPKGDLVADVADRIPANHADRIVLLDPTDEERPLGLNLLAGAHEAPELVTDQVIAIFHQMYSAFWGPRTQDVLHASLLTLSAEPGLTLCELPLLLTNDAFRRRLVSRVDDAIALGPFWSWYEHLRSGERTQAIGPVQNKLRPLLLRRRVRNVIGQARPTFTMGEVLAEPKVLLVSLAKGLLGPEAASLIGSLVVAQLWQAVQARAAFPAAQRRPAFVYADEFQEYTALPTDIADVLAQARGFGIGMVLAHQHLGQLPLQLRGAVLANARSRVVFQAAADDAGVLARQLGGGITPGDLQDLGPFEVYAGLYAAGRVRSPISAHTYPLSEPLGTRGRVREASRARYGRNRAEVEAEIVARQQQLPPDRPIGRTGRRA